jgi:hypothetical protein
MTLNSGEIVCTTKSGCPADGLTLSEIVASPLRPHFGQLMTKTVGILAVWAREPLWRCPNFTHSVLCLGLETASYQQIDRQSIAAMTVKDLRRVWSLAESTERIAAVNP